VSTERSALDVTPELSSVIQSSEIYFENTSYAIMSDISKYLLKHAWR
jgi:hypothetical protein